MLQRYKRFWKKLVVLLKFSNKKVWFSHFLFIFVTDLVCPDPTTTIVKPKNRDYAPKQFVLINIEFALIKIGCIFRII